MSAHLSIYLPTFKQLPHVGLCQPKDLPHASRTQALPNAITGALKGSWVGSGVAGFKPVPIQNASINTGSGLTCYIKTISSHYVLKTVLWKP